MRNRLYTLWLWITWPYDAITSHVRVLASDSDVTLTVDFPQWVARRRHARRYEEMRRRDFRWWDRWVKLGKYAEFGEYEQTPWADPNHDVLGDVRRHMIAWELPLDQAHRDAMDMLHDRALLEDRDRQRWQQPDQFRAGWNEDSFAFWTLKRTKPVRVPVDGDSWELRMAQRAHNRWAAGVLDKLHAESWELRMAQRAHNRWAAGVLDKLHAEALEEAPDERPDL